MKDLSVDMSATSLPLMQQWGIGWGCVCRLLVTAVHQTVFGCRLPTVQQTLAPVSLQDSPSEGVRVWGGLNHEDSTDILWLTLAASAAVCCSQHALLCFQVWQGPQLGWPWWAAT